MNWDNVWQITRYILIAVGSFLVGKGWISAENSEALIGAIGTIGSVIWGLWVKTGTKTVPANVAARADVPTVSAATGAVQK